MNINCLINALNKACYHILCALARLLLRHGIGYTAFIEVAKRAFIDVAHNEFALPGRKQTVSRISALTGITRKDVGQVLKQEPIGELDNVHINRVARVISGWLSDPLYCNSKQQPLDLVFEGFHSFSSLVKDYSGDLTPKTIADELLRSNAIRMLPSGQLRLEQHAYVPQKDVLNQSKILGTDVSDLINTIEHNMNDPTPAFFQRKVNYLNIDEASVEVLREKLDALNQDYLEAMQKTIQTHAKATTSQRKKRLGIGIYYFEEDVLNYENNHDKG